MPSTFTESVVEDAALQWLAGLGYETLSGTYLKRDDFSQVVLEDRLRSALERLNPQIPEEALDEAIRKLTRPESPSLLVNNHTVHQYFTDGIPVEVRRPDGYLGGDLVKIFDFDDPENNDFLAVNQFTIVENKHERRADIVVFVNGLPIAVVELKNAVAENATIWNAFHLLKTYKNEIPSLFAFNEILLISDGVHARIGTLTANQERFMPWRTIDGEELADTKRFSFPNCWRRLSNDTRTGP